MPNLKLLFLACRYVKTLVLNLSTVCEETKTQSPIVCTKFSNWRKLIRVTAYAFRFIWNVRARGHQGSAEDDRAPEPQDAPLSPQELQNVERYWMVESQKTLANCLRRGEFKTLSLYRDPEGIVRVGGQVDKALISYETRHKCCFPETIGSRTLSFNMSINLDTWEWQ